MHFRPFFLGRFNFISLVHKIIITVYISTADIYIILFVSHSHIKFNCAATSSLTLSPLSSLLNVLAHIKFADTHMCVCVLCNIATGWHSCSLLFGHFISFRFILCLWRDGEIHKNSLNPTWMLAQFQFTRAPVCKRLSDHNEINWPFNDYYYYYFVFHLGQRSARRRHFRRCPLLIKLKWHKIN